MSLFSQFRVLLRRGPSVVEELSSPQLLHRPPTPFQFEVGGSSAPDPSGISLSRYHAQVARDLRSSMPSTCRWLGPEEVKLVGDRQIAAGGFANIWEATHDGRVVVLKSYRYSMTDDIARIVARFLNEVHAWNLLHHGNVDVVPLVGVYSTEVHPFGLVYEYMGSFNLKHHLRIEPNARRLKLLIVIVRCLSRMHDMGVFHGDLQTANILVDKDGTPHIAGLSNASILPHSTVEGARTSADRLSRRRAPELIWPGTSPNANDPTHPTDASDMYAFAVMAWEVLTGRPPFHEMTEIAATYSMLNGARPPRPNHREISDRVWYMIERCWHNIPSKRMSAGEAVDLLEAEFRRTSDS